MLRQRVSTIPRKAGRRALEFLVYTAMGYAALAIHRWVFAPALSELSSALQVLLVFANLGAGAWCFSQALRMAWRIAH